MVPRRSQSQLSAEQVAATARPAWPYHVVFEHNSEAALIVKVPDGVITDVNPRGCALYRAVRRDLVGRPLAQLLSENVVAQLWEKLPAESEIVVPRMTHQRLDGTSLLIDLHVLAVPGDQQQAVLICRERMDADVSERITTAAREWQTTADAIEAAILLVAPSGEVLRVNRMVKRLCRKAYRDIIGGPVTELGSSELWNRVAATVREVLETGMSAMAQVHDTQTGLTWEVVASCAARSRDRDVVVVARDITPLVMLHKHLRQGEKLVEMGQLLAGVAHEVRNPLFSMSANLDAFEARVRAGGGGSEPYLDNLRRAINRLSTLMNDLLDYDKVKLPHVEQESLTVIIDEARLTVQSNVEAKKISIQEEAYGRLPTVLMERPRLVQVFENLLFNAISHTPEGGQIVISFNIIEAEARRWVVCRIEDSGPGFSGDTARLFEPFHSTREGGTGLGLLIVRRIIDQHGGRIELANRPEGGASVRVLLPVAG